MVHAVAELHALERRVARAPPLPRADAGVDQRQLDVVQRGGARQQVERLEDEADLAVPHPRELRRPTAARPPAR